MKTLVVEEEVNQADIKRKKVLCGGFSEGKINAIAQNIDKKA